MRFRWAVLTVLGCLTAATVEGASKPSRSSQQNNQRNFQQSPYRSPLSGMMNRNQNNRNNPLYGNPANSFTELIVTTDENSAWRIAYAPTNATAEDKQKLKGDDKKLPGYTGTNDDLKVDLTVKISRAKKRPTDPNKPDETRYAALPDIIGTCKRIDGTAQFVVRYQNPANSYIPNNNNNNRNRQQQQQQQQRQPQTQDADTVVTIVYIYNKATTSDSTTASTKGTTKE